MTGVAEGASVPGGTLLPARYVTSTLVEDARRLFARRDLAPVPGYPWVRDDPRLPSRFLRWWTRVVQACGPATPLRTIFDLVAMPFFALLRFRCEDVAFEHGVCRTRLIAFDGTPVALVLCCWASHPPTRWVDLARYARAIGTSWGVVMAPPFVSIVAARGFATRRSLDFVLPDALEPANLPVTITLADAGAFARLPATGGGPTRECLLDHLLERGAAFQDAVRADLQQGVEASLRLLAPAVDEVVDGRRRATGVARAGATSAFDEALTLVYRVLFLLFAESRHLVPVEAGIYRAAYAVSRFCHHASTAGCTPGLWASVAATSRLSRLGCDAGELPVAAFNGALFARGAAPRLEARSTRSRRPVAARCDEAMRATLIALGSRRTKTGVEAIAYRDLGVEQLGAVYERVLDLDAHDSDAHDGRSPRTPGPRRPRHSGFRRRTGTFYTPQPLAELVVRQTLAPLVSGRTAEGILDLRVLDPAMGSGAFLVAACRYLAAACEDALVGEGRLSPEDVDEHERARLRRLVAERCLAGVDRNPTAVQLARLSLWLTTLARDRPLGFLDHRLRIGDSLIGAWPGDLWRLSMRPAGAATAPLFEPGSLAAALAAAVAPLRTITERPSDTVEDVRAKEASWRQVASPRSPLHRWRLALHVWCARWFRDGGPAPAAAETRAVLDALVRGDRTLHEGRVTAAITEAERAAAAHAFFHWPIEFPDVFAATDRAAGPGFDAIVGNPPWEMARRDDDGPADLRPVVAFVRGSGLYPSCTRGHLNLYQAFVDRSLSLLRPGGRLGMVLPWGIAVDDGAAPLRQRLFDETRVESFVGLDNARGLFPIHRGLRVAVVTAAADGPTRITRAVFGLRTGADLDALPAEPTAAQQPVAFTPAELEVMSGPARRIPDLRRARDRDLILGLCRRFPRLGDPRGWGITFGRELNATDIRPWLGERGVPVVEGKHLSPFRLDGRGAARLPRSIAQRMLASTRWEHPRVGYRDVSGAGNRLTLIAAIVPAGIVTSHTIFCARTALPPARQHLLCALLNSYVLNALVRMLMGGHVTTTLAEHLPAPAWQGDARDRCIARLAARLARPGGGVQLTARLQALVAAKFGLDAPTLGYVLDGFPLVPPDERAAVLEAFDAGRRSSSRSSSIIVGR